MSEELGQSYEKEAPEIFRGRVGGILTEKEDVKSLKGKRKTKEFYKA